MSGIFQGIFKLLTFLWVFFFLLHPFLYSTIKTLVGGGAKYFLLVAGFHGHEIPILVKTHTAGRNHFNIHFKVDSLCCLKF